MAVDKALYQAPKGLGSLDEVSLSVEIVDPEAIDSEMDDNTAEDFNENIAELMPESQLMSLASELLGDYDTDISSRKEWLDTYVKGLKLLGLKYEERTEPWPGASGVFHPLLMEAAVKFQSDLIMETFPAAGPVRTKIVGKETPEKKKAAARVQEDMNYQTTEVMPEYRPEHERLLLAVALSGNAFKKIYFDPALNRQVAPFIPAEDVIVPYGAANLESAERITHRMRKTKNEVRRLQVAGFYRDEDLGDPVHVLDEVEKEKAKDQGFSASTDDRFQLLEMHVELDLEGYEDTDEEGNETGIKLPYVVTIEKGTSTVLAIRRNWLEDDRLKQRRQHFVHYGYIPGFGFYYFGLIHLIGGHTHTATSILRQLIDAGTLSNLPGGLKAKGLRIKGDDTPIAPGEFRDVDLPSGAIRDNILPLPYKEPSQVLMALMDKVVQDGRQFAASAELSVSDMSANAPVGTTLAILERVMKVISAVQARVHYAMKQEFKLLAAIIRDNTPESYDYDPETGDAGAKRADYDCCDVLPVSDPNASTMAQRVVQYQAVLQLAQGAPQIYDLPFLHRQMIEILGVKNANKIVPLKDEVKPMDPVSENMAILVGKPVKAFLYQDHQSHIAVHMAAMHDPKLGQIMEQNPQAQGIQAAAMAHLMEHTAMEYRRQIEQNLGSLLPPPPQAALSGEDMEDTETGYMSPQLEVQISQLQAMAAQKLAQNNQQEAQQQKNQQQQQDPIIQMQQQDLQLRQQELQLKQQKLQLDSQIAMAEQQRKEKKDATDYDAKLDELRIRAEDSANRHHLDSTKVGIDLGKNQDNIDMQMEHKQMENKRARALAGIDLLKHSSSLEQQEATGNADRQHQAEMADKQAQQVQNQQQESSE